MKRLKSLKIPYGDTCLRFSLPAERFLGILQKRPPRIFPVKRLLSEALNAPLGGKKLEEAASGKKKILIVAPDSTRKAHLKEILPGIIKKIERPSRTVDIIIATGLHKKHGAAELAALMGPEVLRQHRVFSHAQASGTIIAIGSTREGVPITLNKAVREHDFIISVGVIEPHLYAGYSGGAKTLAIGLAGEDTINATHGVRFLDDPSTAIGSVRANRFQRVLWQIAGKAPLEFAVNVVNDPDGRPAKIFSGAPEKVFASGVDFARKIFEIEVKKPAGIVICGVGYPKDVNLYQASRAINYVLNVDRPVVKKNGVVIVVARMEDGPGDGIAERRFYAAMRRMASAESFISRIKRCGCQAGVHRAYMVAKAITRHKIIFVSTANGKMMRSLPLVHFEDIDEAVEYADGIAGASSGIYVIPRGLSTIARLEPANQRNLFLEF
jgi:nickel-dependent lactate racemase